MPQMSPMSWTNLSMIMVISLMTSKLVLMSMSSKTGSPEKMSVGCVKWPW